MPPVRTMTAPKPVKTERTHEENQERAYIAASRRSDRSLEARVESARRASEIHKRRTGRSLRVTEQDVVNEEMYEEEDDDLPMQYRRLTAHLQTSNADFDRRLAAYLTNHVAMRTALGQAVSGYNQQQQQFPNAAQFANQGQQQFQPHAFNTNPQSMMPPQNRSPSMYRSSPYPTNPQAFKNMHNRSASIASPHELHNGQSGQSPVDIKTEDRRMSLPAQNMPPTPGNQGFVSPTVSRTPSTSNIANLKFEAAQSGLYGRRMQQQQQNAAQSNANLQPSMFPSAFNNNLFDTNSSAMNSGFFSTALPLESQQLLGGAFDPNDPMTSMLMGGNSKTEQPFYNYNPDDSSKKNFSPSSGANGMNQTLAPSMLDLSSPQFGLLGGPQSASADSVLSPWNNFGSSGFDNSFGDAFKSSGLSLDGQTSGQVTPSGDHDWSNLIDGNAWEEQTSSQTALA